MSKDPMQALEALLAERAAQPFGDHERVSGQALQPFSQAGHVAARNLLTKVAAALDAGDDDRARTLAGKAAALPWDRHEDCHPAVYAASMCLFSAVSDAMKEAFDEDESQWLDAALVAAAAADDDARGEFRHALAAIDQDYQVARRERSRLRELMASLPEAPELIDLDLAAPELVDRLLSTMALCNAYDAALDAAAGAD